MPDPVDLDPDLIWIRDAPREYGRSDTWFFQQIAAGTLNEVRFPGDRRVYLRKSQIEKFLGIDQIRRQQQQFGGPPPQS